MKNWGYRRDVIIGIEGLGVSEWDREEDKIIGGKMVR